MSNFEYVFNKQDEKTAKQLYDEHRHELPMLVVVATGFYGNREEITFSTGQVLRLHEVHQQWRALVHDDKKHTLSVPLDYSHLFFVGNNHTEALTLRQVIDIYELPVKVKFADPHVQFALGDDRARSLSTLKIVRVHEEPYFLANTIAQDVPLKDVLPLPLYLREVTFCPVVGVKGPGITDGGKSQMDRMLHPEFVTDVDFSRDHGDKEMVQLSEKPLKASDNIHQNIETNVYVNVSQVRRRQPPSPSAPRAAEAAAADERTTAAPWERRSVADPEPDREKLYQNVADFSYTAYNTAPETKPDRPPKPANLRPRPGPPPPRPPRKDTPESVPRGSDEQDTGVYEVFGGAPDERLTSSSSTEPDKHQSKKTRQEVSRGRPNSSAATPGVGAQITTELAKALLMRKKKVESLARAPVPSGDAAEPATPGKRLDMEGDSRNTEQPWAGKVKLKPTHPNRQSVSDTSRSSQAASSPPPPPPPAPPAAADTQKAAASAGPLTASAAGPPPQAAAAKPPTKADKPPTSGRPRTPPSAKPTPFRPAKNTAVAAAGPDSPQAGKPAAALHPLQAPAPAPSTSKSSTPATTTTTTTTTPQDTATGTSTPQPPPLAATAIPPGHDAGVSQTQATDDASMYINQSQMAVVGPTQHKPEAKPSGQGVAPPPHSEALDAMTIADVKQLLTKLNLARFHQQFEQNQVDGVLLRELDANTLRGDFGMTRIETMRLRNFVERGHLPK